MTNGRRSPSHWRETPCEPVQRPPGHLDGAEMTVPAMTPTVINDRWTLLLPEHRAARPEWATGWEVARINSMHANLRAGDVVIDVGAEEGDLSALWASWGCGVVLVEPNPRVWPNIRAVFDANRLSHRVAGCFAGFASDRTVLDPPNLDIPEGERGGWPECAYGPVIGDHGFRHLAQEADATPQITLDDLCVRHLGPGERGPGGTLRALAVPSALTIDVEGAELVVLRGAARLLAEGGPLVWVSVHHEFMGDMYGHSFADIAELMGGYGYTGRLLGEDHEEHWLFCPAGRDRFVR